MSAPFMDLVTVTPERAAALLAENPYNRRLDPGTVRRYASDMRSGLWRYPTSETIAVGPDGALHNGQHRLSAVVASGKTIQFWICFNADPAEFAVLDQGKRRTTNDALRTLGVGDGFAIGAAVRAHLLLERRPDLRWTGQITPSIAEVLDFTTEHPDLVRSTIAQGREVFRTALVTGSAWAAVGISVSLGLPELDPRWVSFYEQVKSGEGLSSGDPAFTLRKWALSNRDGVTNRRGVHRRGMAQMRIVAITKTWNAYVRNEPMHMVKWLESESMPTPEKGVTA